MMKPKRVKKSDETLVRTDSPDDVTYEGRFDEPLRPRQVTGDDPYVTVDNPDDFE